MSKMIKLKFLIISVTSIILLSACDRQAEMTHDDMDQTKQHQMEGDQSEKYTCPMHPHYISTDPDGSCPICGMDLVTVENTESELVESEEPSIQLSSTMIQTIGVRTQKASIAELGSKLRAFGTVEPNQTLENVSVARLEGWIETLLVKSQGETVKKGQELYRVYSPTLLSAQKDYLSALQIANRQRISAVEQRLISLGMPDSLIKKIKANKKTIPQVSIFAEADGVVMDIHVRQGDYIKPGTPILRLQSFENVWVIAQIPETDLPMITPNLTAQLEFSSAPSQSINRNIDYIYPTINAETRTAQVRFEVSNDSGQLLPGAYADIEFTVDQKMRLVVPTESILRDSRGEHVIIALGDGKFRPQTIVAGLNGGNGQTEVISGLNEGDLVVVSGQFLLDSEANLREGLSKLIGHDAHQGHSEMSMQDDTDKSAKKQLAELELDSATLAQLDHFVDAAIYIHDTLVTNNELNPQFLDPAVKLADNLSVRLADTELVPVLKDSQRALITAQQAKTHQALLTQLDGLTQAIMPWLLNGKPEHYQSKGITIYVDTDSERHWIQHQAEPINPYGDGHWRAIQWSANTDHHMHHEH